MPQAGLSGGVPGLTFKEGYIEVEELKGVRLVLTEEPPVAEYLVQWKDGSGDTWERAGNLSEDLLRKYEERWWTAAKKADAETLVAMLAGGREVLANALDENRRSALHFAAATGNVDCTKLLLEAGAEVNLQDKDGYTPLHMAAGYMYTGPMTLLVEAGADPSIRDASGKDVPQLIENLRGALPLSVQTLATRMRLEEAANCLTSQLYDEVEPSRILEVRSVPLEKDKKDAAKAEAEAEDKAAKDPNDPSVSDLEDDKLQPAATRRQFLVQFADGRPDEWIDEANMAADVVADYDAGLEYAEALEVIDVAQVGTERRFKVRWADDYPTSWEEEEHIPSELIALFQQQNPQLFDARTSGACNSWEDVIGSGEVNGAGGGQADGRSVLGTQAAPDALASFIHSNGASGGFSRNPQGKKATALQAINAAAPQASASLQHDLASSAAAQQQPAASISYENGAVPRAAADASGSLHANSAVSVSQQQAHDEQELPATASGHAWNPPDLRGDWGSALHAEWGSSSEEGSRPDANGHARPITAVEDKQPAGVGVQ